MPSLGKLKNCPQEFYSNCKNSMKYCHLCTAGNRGGKTHYYEPIEDVNGLKEHPYGRSLKKRNIFKKATQNEERIASSIARRTIRSGAALGDGDHRILEGTLNLRQEVKDRGKRSSWNVTWDEYLKGVKQGISVYAISVDCPDGKTRTMYFLNEELYTDLLAIAHNTAKQLEKLNELITKSETEV